MLYQLSYVRVSTNDSFRSAERRQLRFCAVGDNPFETFKEGWHG
jgi:hypothetical protein